eukprot:1437494-Pleurochrysis_carterae.AAC.1
MRSLRSSFDTHSFSSQRLISPRATSHHRRALSSATSSSSRRAAKRLAYLLAVFAVPSFPSSHKPLYLPSLSSVPQTHFLSPTHPLTLAPALDFASSFSHSPVLALSLSLSFTVSSLAHSLPLSPYASTYPSPCLPTYRPPCLPTYRPPCLPTYPPPCLPTYPPPCLPTDRPASPPTHRPAYLPTH